MYGWLNTVPTQVPVRHTFGHMCFLLQKKQYKQWKLDLLSILHLVFRDIPDPQAIFKWNVNGGWSLNVKVLSHDTPKENENYV